MEQFRQGDVLLTRVPETPTDARELDPDHGLVVLAYGELTGHHHSVRASGAALLGRSGGERFLRLLDSQPLIHQEHDPITLPAGTYRVTIQREYSPEAVRQVAD